MPLGCRGSVSAESCSEQVSLLLPVAAVSRFKLVLAKSTAPPSFVAGMQRRQCVALCFIFMLAGAEAVRTAESANVMHSVVLHSGRRSSQSFEGTMDVAGSEMIPSSDSLMRHLTALNTSAEDVQDGKGFWRVKNCMMTCPLIWTKIIYHSWLARSDAKKIVADSFAAGDDVAMLPSVSQPLGDSFRGTMRKTVWTFLKVTCLRRMFQPSQDHAFSANPSVPSQGPRWANKSNES